jgi:hypothetical protein
MIMGSIRKNLNSCNDTRIMSFTQPEGGMDCWKANGGGQLRRKRQVYGVLLDGPLRRRTPERSGTNRRNAPAGFNSLKIAEKHRGIGTNVFRKTTDQDC